jgi:hypothetical protein
VDHRGPDVTDFRAGLCKASRRVPCPSMPPRRFEFDFDPRYERAARPFGVTPDRAWVDVGDGRLDARYGRWRLRTPLANVRSAQLTGPYRFAKTAGPARLAVTDLGLTFASNGRRGVLIRFHRRVGGIDPFGLIRHGELTVTVADPEQLVGLLESAIAEGPAVRVPRTR